MGVRYEKRVHQEFQRRYGDYYFESPWFVFKEMEAERPRFCQPDGLLIDIQQGRIIIVEAKYSHTSDAWWQLQRYGSVVSKAFSPNSEFAVIGLEVCKWFDPAVRAPQKPTMCSDLHYANQGSFNVHIWRP